MLTPDYEWQDIVAAEEAVLIRREMSAHNYLSTSCAHDRHAYCKAEGVKGEIAPFLTRYKKPAECKFCSAECICICHCEESDDPTGQGSICMRHGGTWPCEEGWSKYTTEEWAEIQKRGGVAPLGDSYIDATAERAEDG